jgi:hypothetical protein
MGPQPDALSETRLGYARVSETFSTSYQADIPAFWAYRDFHRTLPVGLYTGIGQAGPSATTTENLLQEDISK